MSIAGGTGNFFDQERCSSDHKKNSNLNSIESAPEENNSSNKVVPNASGYYVDAWGWEEETDFSNRIGTARGSTGTLTCSVSYSEQASYSADVSVSSGIVSAGVGYSVTKTFTLTEGRTTVINAYPIYEITWYDVFDIDGDEIGSGWAMRLVGAQFIVNQY